MSFASESFLFLFLPLFLGLYYLTPKRFRNLTMLLESYLFYGWWRLDFLLILIGTTIWTYYAGKLMMRARDARAQRALLTIGVIGCLAVLAIFKYLNFFLDSMAMLVGSTPEDLGIHWRILFPIGVSFYVFHSVSYLVDVHRGHAAPARNLVDFAGFLAMFPQLMAGPLLRYKDLAHQFVERKTTLDMFTEGWIRFVLGLGKKVIIADNLAILTDHLYLVPEPTLFESWLAALTFMLQVYFDFSGYSSMAIGLALMFGFRFAENFRTPFHARSVTEVFQRWHISLGSWLFTYVHQPLGGAKGGKFKMLRNVFLVSFLGGVWHGANFTFVFWGVWKGAFLVLERGRGWLRRDRSVWYGTFGMLFVVAIAAAMFRSVDFGQGVEMFKGMAGFNGIGFRAVVAIGISREALFWLAIAIIITWKEPQLQRLGHFVPVDAERPGPAMAANFGRSLLALAIATLAIVQIADHTYQPFLYYQF